MLRPYLNVLEATRGGMSVDHSYRVLTSRLLLRPLTEHDLEIVLRWRRHDHIRKWFQDDLTIEPKQQLTWYERYRQREDDMMFVAVVLNENKPIGAGSLYRINKLSRTAEFGRVFIGEADAQGMGYGEEIVRGITDFGVEMLSLRWVELFVKITNTNAIRTYTNCGYVHDRKYRPSNSRDLGSIVRMIRTAPPRWKGER